MLLLDEPFTGLDAASADAARGADRRARRARAARCSSPPTTSSRRARWDRVLCLNRRQIAFGAPGDVLTRERARGDLRRPTSSRSCADGARRGVLPAHHHHHDDVMAVADVDWLSDPWRTEIGRRALLEVVLLGVAGGALGCWVVLLRPLLQRRVARARAASRGSWSPRCSASRWCSAARSGSLVGRARRRARRRACRRSARDTAVAVVVTTPVRARRAARALARHAAGPAGPAVRRRARRHGRRPGCSRPALVASSCWSRSGSLHARLLVVGFDRVGAPGARRRARSRRRRAAASLLARRRCWSPCRGSATCSSSRC